MATLEAELARVEVEIAERLVVRDYLRKRLGERNGHKPAAAPRRQKGRLTAAAAAQQALEAHEGPMRTPDILHAVQAAGAKMKDTDGMYKTLDRDKARFRKAGRGLWELARPDQEG